MNEKIKFTVNEDTGFGPSYQYYLFFNLIPPTIGTFSPRRTGYSSEYYAFIHFGTIADKCTILLNSNNIKVL